MQIKRPGAPATVQATVEIGKDTIYRKEPQIQLLIICYLSSNITLNIEIPLFFEPILAV